MLLGLDFDNTLANYNVAFISLAIKKNLIDCEWTGNKLSLRNYLRTFPDGEFVWQQIQGKVYGKWMHEAVLFDGVRSFLSGCKAKNIPVCIVSHKTIYGIHDDEKIPLREEAWKWMKAQGFFADFGIDESDVYFESTKEEKIKRIESLGCTHYIDDLLEILLHPKFPASTKKILFTEEVRQDDLIDIVSFKDWNELDVDSFA